MPKRPDLIAAEMQGDATIPPAIERAVAKAYASNKDDPAVVHSLQRIFDEGMRELAGETPDAAEPENEVAPEPPAEHGRNGGAAKRGLRRLLSRG